LAIKKIRIAELAKELGWTNKETLDRSKEMGIDVKNVSSSMEEAQADRVRRKAVKEGLVRDVQPAEEKPAKKAPAKKAAAPKKEKAEGVKKSGKLVANVNFYDIIERPIVTEKSTALSEHNKVVFKVNIASSVCGPPRLTSHHQTTSRSYAAKFLKSSRVSASTPAVTMARPCLPYSRPGLGTSCSSLLRPNSSTSSVVSSTSTIVRLHA
jgi:CCR4-NOT transcriptional regulation complex NOT5 subunit